MLQQVAGLSYISCSSLAAPGGIVHTAGPGTPPSAVWGACRLPHLPGARRHALLQGSSGQPLLALRAHHPDAQSQQDRHCRTDSGAGREQQCGRRMGTTAPHGSDGKQETSADAACERDGRRRWGGGEWVAGQEGRRRLRVCLPPSACCLLPTNACSPQSPPPLLRDSSLTPPTHSPTHL